MPFYDSDHRLFMTDFGDDCLYVPDAGEAVPGLKVLFNSKYAAIEELGFAGVESTEPTAICITEDFPDIKRNEILEINGITYYVKETHDNGTGFKLIYLTEDEANV